MWDNAGLLFAAIIGLACVVILSPFLVRLVLSVRRARRDIRQSRERLLRDAYFCVHCGHDVRVNSGRCPECGEAI